MSGGQISQLVKMANQIALNLGGDHYPERAAQRAQDHIVRFWTPAMCEQLLAYWREGGEGLSPVVVVVLESLAAESVDG